METTAIQKKVSPVDALWTLYQQQTEQVRRAFIVRVRQNDFLVDMPGMHSREEMMEAAKERMRDIISGREKTFTHEEAMMTIDNAISEAI